MLPTDDVKNAPLEKRTSDIEAQRRQRLASASSLLLCLMKMADMIYDAVALSALYKIRAI